MEALTYENVYKFVVDNGTDMIWHPTSISYILNLVVPYGLAIEPAADVDSIIEWIPITFLEKISYSILYDLNGKRLDVNGAKIAVIKSLIELMRDTIVANLKSCKIILPWNVQHILSNNLEFSDAFGLNSEIETIPVGIVFGPDVFTHQVTEEFVAGLSIFSSFSNLKFSLRIYGKELNPNIFMDRYLYTEEDKSMFNFTINIKNKTYKFNTRQFLKGFVTNTTWSNLNHIYHWTKLIHYTEFQPGIIKQQELIF